MEFQTWLEAQPHKSVVGFAGVPYNNPLACWLDETDALQTNELFRVAVENWAVLRDGMFVRDLTTWERKFLARVNAQPENEAVTREMADTYYQEATRHDYANQPMVS